MPGLYTGAQGLFGGFPGFLYGTGLSTPPGLLADALFGSGTSAGNLLGPELSGLAIDFVSQPADLLSRSYPRNLLMNYSDAPFQVAGGPVTFSRGSLATVTDSDGLIKWAPHNLLLASEQFDATNWTKSSATVTANSEAAPNNTDTADTITASGANGTALQSYTALAVPYTFGVWLKRKTGTGTIEIAADNGTYVAKTITSDWALYTVTQTPAAGSKSAGIRIVTSADEVYAWGAHLYRSDLGGMQANASAYPYYNSSTPKNLLGYSEAFEQWGKQTAGDTISKNASIAPNGSLSADLWVADGTSSSHRIETVISIIPKIKTYSFYAKAQTASAFVQLSTAGTIDGWVNFDLLAGTSSDQGTGMTGTITPVGDSWYRCSVHCTIAAATNPRISHVSSLSAARIETAALSSGIYLWGAQISDSASLDTYVPNFGAAPSAAAAYGPRLDYDPVTLAAKGLLVEEARTNVVLHNSDLTQAAWSATNVTTAKTQTGPDGTANSATLLTATAGNGTVLQAITLASSARFQSAYVKRVTGTGTIEMTMDNGSTWTAVTVTSSWTRVSIPTQTLANPTVGFRIVTSGDEIAVFGVQNENGAFATSVIPTAASTVTRNADVATVGVSQFPYSATEGSIIANVTPFNVAAARRAVQIDNATENERYTLSTNSTPNGLFTVIDDGSSQAAISTGTPAANTNIKLAARYKVDDFALSVNGGAASTDTTGTLPTADLLMRLGSGTSSAEPLNGYIRQITYIPRALTDAELATRSA